MTLVVKEFKSFGDRPHRNRQLTQQKWSGLGDMARRGNWGLAGLLQLMKGSLVPGAATGPVGNQGGMRAGGGKAATASQGEDIINSA